MAFPVISKLWNTMGNKLLAIQLKIASKSLAIGTRSKLDARNRVLWTVKLYITLAHGGHKSTWYLVAVIVLYAILKVKLLVVRSTMLATKRPHCRRSCERWPGIVENANYVNREGSLVTKSSFFLEGWLATVSAFFQSISRALSLLNLLYCSVKYYKYQNLRTLNH